VSKAWVCRHLLAGIADSNPAGGINVSLVSVVCCTRYRGLCDNLITRPEESYRYVVLMNVILEPRLLEGPGLLRADGPWGERAENVVGNQRETTYFVSEFCTPF